MKATIILSILFFAKIGIGQNRISKLDSLLNTLYSDKKINGNILVAEKGKVIYSQCFGYANEYTQEKLNSNSIFELASCSKQFTAMAIMILNEKGKLTLDDDISKYISEFSFYKGITIRHLLNHTGGLADYMDLMDSLFDKSKIAINEDIITIFNKHQPKILFEPNSKYEYSNTGYALLASIVERVSGQPFADFLNQWIFKPLQMEHTFIYTRRLFPRKIENYAFGYIYSDSLNKYVLPDELDETKMVIWLDGIVGDGCVNSTIHDLLKWDRALYTNILLSTKGINDIFDVAILNDKSKTEYGLGWEIENHTDYGKIACHSGGWPGYSAFIDRHLTNDKTIIILQNHDGLPPPIDAIRAILYNEVIPSSKNRIEVKLSNEQIQKITGVYELEKGVDVNILVSNDQLFAQITGQKAYPIFAENELLFFLKVVDAQIEFKRNEINEVTKLYIFQNGNKTEAKRKK